MKIRVKICVVFISHCRTVYND